MTWRISAQRTRCAVLSRVRGFRRPMQTPGVGVVSRDGCANVRGGGRRPGQVPDVRRCQITMRTSFAFGFHTPSNRCSGSGLNFGCCPKGETPRCEFSPRAARTCVRPPLGNIRCWSLRCELYSVAVGRRPQPTRQRAPTNRWRHWRFRGPAMTGYPNGGIADRIGRRYSVGTCSGLRRPAAVQVLAPAMLAGVLHALTTQSGSSARARTIATGNGKTMR